MKEAEIFENYMNRLSEGTWALPDTPEAYEKLQQLMTGELIVGADAMNATEQLYDLVGDVKLFDILNDLADNDPRANIWDDSDVQRRLAELGVQTPQSTQAAPADVPQDTAPPVAEGELDEQVMGGQMNMFQTFSNNVANGQDAKQAALAVAKDYGMKPEQVMFDLASFGKQSPQWINTPELQNAVKTLQQLAAANRAFDPQIEESNELAEMLKYAGVPIKEGVLTDSTGSTLEHIKDTFKRDIKDFSQSGEMSEHLFRRLYDYYFDDMPYGAKTGDDIDPYQWVGDRFAEDLGINENLISPMIMPVSESSCNMTAEGSYCPEHGLMECGSMYEDDSIPRIEIRGFGPDFEDLPAGNKLINPIQPRRHNELSPLKSGDSTPHSPVAHVDLTVDESTDDPINYNAAMTGSYYEGKETDIREGDALLARIKSLALLR